jgi:hypothetical protein
MVGAAGFDQGDGPRKGRALTGLEASRQRRDVESGLGQMRIAVPEAVTISIEPFCPTVS